MVIIITNNNNNSSIFSWRKAQRIKGIIVKKNKNEMSPTLVAEII